MVNKVAAAVVVLIAAAGAAIASEMWSMNVRDSACRDACRVLESEMALANRYGCFCRDENGSFILGNEYPTD